MTGGGWTWALPVAVSDLDLAEDLADDLARGWASQVEAEDWLREVYADLLEAGAHRAVLMDGARQAYSMRLDPGT